MRRRGKGSESRSRTDGTSGDPAEAADPALPASVTSIRPQVKRPDRFSLYHEERFLIGVSGATLLRFNLHKGLLLTPALYSKLADEEEKRAIRDYFLRLLGRRDHAREELKRKALKRGHSALQADHVLLELDQKGTLDDEAFARKFITDKVTISYWGPVKIRFELLRKGIPGKTIDHILSDGSADLELQQICVDLALKRKRHFARETDELKRKRKIAAYLQRRGFTCETINRVLPDIMNRLNA